MMPAHPAVVATLSELWIAVHTSAGVAAGCVSRKRAATPATCGVAWEVPEKMLVAVSLALPAERMLTPGAKRSRQVPKFEKPARVSLAGSTAPTVIAAGTRAGEALQASAFELPAATAKVTPAAIALPTDVSSAVNAPNPMLKLATAGSVLFAVTQSTPEMASAPATDP